MGYHLPQRERGWVNRKSKRLRKGAWEKLYNMTLKLTEVVEITVFFCSFFKNKSLMKFQFPELLIAIFYLNFKVFFKTYQNQTYRQNTHRNKTKANNKTKLYIPMILEENLEFGLLSVKSIISSFL